MIYGFEAIRLIGQQKACTKCKAVLGLLLIPLVDDCLFVSYKSSHMLSSNVQQAVLISV